MRTKELTVALRAGYSFFYARTNEMQRATDAVKETIENFKINNEQVYKIIVWDFEKDQDPEKVCEQLDSSSPGTLIIAKNFNWFLKDEYGGFNKQIVSFIQNRLEIFSSAEYDKKLLIISDQLFENAIPGCLQKDFLSLELGLPDKEDIEGIYNFIIDSANDNSKFEEPNAEEKNQIILSCRGMTKREIQNALSYAIIKGKGKIDPKVVSRIRARDIEKTAGLRIGEHNLNFESLKGYDEIKKFTKATINSTLAKGIMLLGPPGTGKTHFCKCLGYESGLDVFEMEVAELFGGLVGESEKLMKTALEVIALNAPCILFIDEIEKALAGVGNSQSGDGGTTKRSMAQLLKFLSDTRPEGVYVVATCNNIAQLPPEWVRAERWDCAPFFIDLPNKNEQEEILKHYKEVFDVKGRPSNMKGWSGAETKSACRIAAMMERKIHEVENFIVPVSSTMKNEIDGLRKWAIGKTIPASTVVKENGVGKRKINL